MSKIKFLLLIIGLSLTQLAFAQTFEVSRKNFTLIKVKNDRIKKIITTNDGIRWLIDQDYGFATIIPENQEIKKFQAIIITENDRVIDMDLVVKDQLKKREVVISDNLPIHLNQEQQIDQLINLLTKLKAIETVQNIQNDKLPPKITHELVNQLKLHGFSGHLIKITNNTDRTIKLETEKMLNQANIERLIIEQESLKPNMQTYLYLVRKIIKPQGN